MTDYILMTKFVQSTSGHLTRQTYLQFFRHFEHSSELCFFVTDYAIIESVDCIVIARHAIYDGTKNFRYGKLISLYNNVPFIFECYHDEQHALEWCKKRHESIEAESRRTTKTFKIV